MLDILPLEILHELILVTNSKLFVNLLQTNSIFYDLLLKDDINIIKNNSLTYKIKNMPLGISRHPELPNGWSHGISECYNDKGNTTYKLHFHDNKRHGIIEIWDYDCTPIMRGEYVNDERYGIWTFWNKTGNRIDVEIVNNNDTYLCTNISNDIIVSQNVHRSYVDGIITALYLK